VKRWEKVSMTKTADGGSVIRYEAEGCPCAIESRKRLCRTRSGADTGCIPATSFSGRTARSWNSGG
jgi:hypothetical protein